MSVSQDRAEPQPASGQNAGEPSLLNVALLLVRLAIGAVFIGHGAQKLFGIWGGPGMAGFAGMLKHMGLPQPMLFAYLAALAEFAGGLGLLTGTLARLAGAGIVVDMLVAIFQVHLKNGLLGAGPGKPGFDFPLACLSGALTIVLLGAGRYSLDDLFRRAYPSRRVP
jgi:putative oxidoreductase